MGKIIEIGGVKSWNFCVIPNSGCKMNMCDENGCQERNRELVDFFEKDPLGYHNRKDLEGIDKPVWKSYRYKKWQGIGIRGLSQMNKVGIQDAYILKLGFWIVWRFRNKAVMMSWPSQAG